MKYLVIYLLIFVMITSCEQIVEIELPEYEPRISMSCYYHPDDYYVDARLFENISIDSTSFPDIIGNATVLMYENGHFFEEFEGSSPNSSNYRYRNLSPAIPGNTYTLTAQVEGFSDVSATQIMPYPPAVTLSEFINDSDIIVGDNRQDIYKITLEDDPDIDNYYEFRIFTRKKENAPYGNWTIRNLRSPYSQIETGGKTLYLKDNSFNGETYQVELLSNTRDTSMLQIKVQVNTITRDKFLFIQTLSAYQDAQYNPFAEPVIIHSNVENGMGVFSMENWMEILIE